MLYITQGESGVDTGRLITTVRNTYLLTGKSTPATVDAFIHESDTNIPYRSVSASLDWNDGSLAVSFPKTNGGLLHISTTRSLKVGSYVVSLRAQNYETPVEKTAQVNLFFDVVSQSGNSSDSRYLFGPILPRDSGYPNTDQWEFQLNSDTYVLESSAKMLLLTSKGDRLMEPGYGTRIRQYLFDSNLPGIESLIREEIVNAFATWEPRLSLGDLIIERDPNGRSVVLNLTLVSNLNKQPFETRLEFVR